MIGKYSKLWFKELGEEKSSKGITVWGNLMVGKRPSPVSCGITFFDAQDQIEHQEKALAYDRIMKKLAELKNGKD